MDLYVLSGPSGEQVEQRLSKIAGSWRRFRPDSIQDLSHPSAGAVYVVPFDACLAEDWPQVRVRLAQANRYYVMVGGALATGEIVRAMRDGAFDVLQMVDDDNRWMAVLKKAQSSQELWLQLYGGSERTSPQNLLGQSVAMKSLRQAIDRLGPTAASVLILGESGVGKERVAEALHTSSGRGAFVAVNCAAIPKELMEAELFGAEKGAYTGAVKTRAGLVEQASGGTLFLDEIGELDYKLQPKLLRFLESRKTRRVGGHEEIQAEVRVLSATNSNLEAQVVSGEFRSDLYYRLSEVILHITPLRTRPDDIPQLAKAFLQAAGERLGKYFETIEPELIKKLQTYDWPGNVRELRNAIDRLAILYDGPMLRAGWWELPRPLPAPGFGSRGGRPYGAEPGVPTGMGTEGGNAQGLPLNRKQRLESARQLLESSGNDLTWVAAQLGIHPTTLYRWRKAGKL